MINQSSDFKCLTLIKSTVYSLILYMRIKIGGQCLEMLFTLLSLYEKHCSDEITFSV